MGIMGFEPMTCRLSSHFLFPEPVLSVVRWTISSPFQVCWYLVSTESLLVSRFPRCCLVSYDRQIFTDIPTSTHKVFVPE